MLTIRAATIDDAPSIHRIHTSAIREICSRSYPPDAIADWSGALAIERYIDAMGECDFEIAELDGVPAGFSVLDVPHKELHALYVSPPHCRRGVGRALLAHAEERAAARGIPELHLKATINAVSFYEACGWEAIAPTTHPLPSGRKLASVVMRKALLPGRQPEKELAVQGEGSP